jgi:hypothetical protein
MSGISASGGYTTLVGVQVDHTDIYYWVAAFSGNSNHNRFTSGCNDAARRTVRALPRRNRTPGGNVGATVHDSATLTGVATDADGTVIDTVYSDSGYTNKVADGDGDGYERVDAEFERRHVQHSGAYWW